MNPAPILRRVPAFVLGLLPIFAVLFIVAYAFSTWWQNFEQATADKLLKFDRLRSVASYKPRLDGSGTIQGEDAFKDLFLGEGTEAVVSADLLARLKQMAAELGVEVSRVDGLPLKTEGPLMLVGGGVEMSGTISSILALLQQIEGARPLLFIDRLAIRSNGTMDDEQRSDALLTVEMQVYGAVRSPRIVAATGDN